MATHQETGKRKAALVRELRRDFAQGELSPGAMLPPVRELAARFGISRRLVHDELQKLSGEGWLETVPRVGIFVREAAPVRRFLDHAVVVLSSIPQPNSSHRQSGWLDHVSAGALAEIHRRGLHCVSLHPDRVCQSSLQRLAQDAPLGVVIPEAENSLVYARLVRSHGVRVVVSGEDEELGEFDRVVSDHEEGSYQLTRWLIEQKRRHISMLWMVDPTLPWSRARRRGFERALRESGLPPSPLLDICASKAPKREDLIRVCVQTLQPLFELNTLDAILTPSDGFVSEVEEACRVLGREPNRDVLIGGYDNIWRDLEACGYGAARPAATVDKQNAFIGAEMVRLLLEQVEEGRTQPVRRVVVPQLVVTE